jgi:hypothetical protein
MTRKTAHEYLIKNKQGNEIELLKIIPKYIVSDFIDWGYLKITEDKRWKITEIAIEHYKIFYKPPTFLEITKGWVNSFFFGI